jgi:prophage DNA circulation protein
MPMPYQPWRAALQPASFRGAGFKVEANTMPTGRRNAFHEFAKRDTPFAEDMGRRGRRYTFSAYVIGPNYLADKNALIAACEAGQSGTLVHPTLGTVQVNCDSCVPGETRERGGFASFELVFLESGSLDSGVTPDTQAQASTAAADLSAAAGASLDRSLTTSNAGTIST